MMTASAAIVCSYKGTCVDAGTRLPGGKHHRFAALNLSEARLQDTANPPNPDLECRCRFPNFEMLYWRASVSDGLVRYSLMTGMTMLRCR